MDVLESGGGEIYLQNPDDVRVWMRDKKNRAHEVKIMEESEAVKKFVKDGAYLSYDLTGMVRGPLSLEREIIRQRKRNLWLAAKFTIMDTELLVGAGCVSKVDVGFLGTGKLLMKAVEEGKIKIIEWCNHTMALRHLAGAMGVPFLPTRAVMGSDVFKYSGAKVVTDPFTGTKVCLVPAVNPDAALIHVHQSDEYGNARVFGPSVTPYETAAASKRVILCAEEIIEEDDIRNHPHLTTIPSYMVDAVVKAPFAAHPGPCPGRYVADSKHMREFFTAQESEEAMGKYCEKYVYSVNSHMEYLDKRVGAEKLARLMSMERIREGYHA